MEKIQVTGFCIQEFIISGLYVYATKQILKPGEAFQKKRFRQVMKHLIYVNILVIFMDVTLLCFEYADLYDIQITYKGTVYSIKLRLEFAILNQLRSILSPSGSSHDNGASTQPGERDISLNTFNNRNTNTQAHANGNSSNIYASNTSREVKSPFPGRVDDNHVMMTTEIVIQSEESKQDDKEAEGQATFEDLVETSKGGKNTTASGRASRQKAAYSTNSSEVEFAGAGF
jgi:hypothetical protein